MIRNDFEAVHFRFLFFEVLPLPYRFLTRGERERELICNHCHRGQSVPFISASDNIISLLEPEGGRTLVFVLDLTTRKMVRDRFLGATYVMWTLSVNNLRLKHSLCFRCTQSEPTLFRNSFTDRGACSFVSLLFFPPFFYLSVPGRTVVTT